MPAPTKPVDDTPADDTAETKTFVVAERREVSHGGDSGRVAPKLYVAGDEIELPVAEGERLQELGFLVKDDGSVAVPTGGPATVKGVEIKEQG